MFIELDFLRRTTTERMSTEEKCGLILKHISEGRIVFVEAGLAPFEITKLITSTMELIETNVESNFRGVEIISPDLRQVSHYPGKRFLFKRNSQLKESLPVIITPANINMRMSVS